MSIWKEEVSPIEAPPLTKSTSADVCVIGAGIAGLSAAYLIQRSGADVVVLDRGPIGGGETGQTTAHLASAMDDRFQELERLFGREGARLAWESHAAAIDTIEAIVRGEGIDCELERLDGYLFLGPGQRAELLEAELLAAQRAGFPGVMRLDRAPLELFDTGPCLRFPQQGMFHPLRYLAGLGSALRRDGCRMHAGSMVSRVEGGDTPRVFTRDGL
ncbi:MAG TPA: FAD-binding oxidoreductase, partial [Candidatus Nanopelagicales bacterium]|nr:FAD-binding oxidoreductase [Candidatus Nanopelagicales bacterium]